MVSKKVLEEDPYHLSALPVARPAWLRPCRSSDTTKLNGQERIVRDLFTQILQDAVSFRQQALWYLMIVFDFHSIERKPVLRFISPPWWCSTWPTSLVWCACWRMQRDCSRLLYWSLTWQWSQSPKSLEFSSLACMEMQVHSLPSARWDFLLSNTWSQHISNRNGVTQTICKMLSAQVVFYVAHQLMNAYPSTAIAWYTAGSGR